MRKYIFNKLEVLFVLLALVVLVFTGCSGVPDEANTVNLSFGAVESEDSSRTIQANGGTTCKPGDLYWTYTAVKTSGTGTVGECKTAQSVSFDADGRGLSGFTRQFSTGGWTFTVNGYLEKTHSTMVYSGTKSVVIKTTDTDTVVSFKLTRSTSVAAYEKGIVRFGVLSTTNPVATTEGSKQVLRIYENGTLITQGETDVGTSTTFAAGSNVVFLKFTDPEVTLTAGEHTFDATITNEKGSATELLRGGCFKVTVNKNETTTLSGSLDDSLSPLFKTGGSIFYVDGTSVAGSTNGRITVDGRSFTFYKDTKGTVVGNLSGITAKGAITTTNVLATARYYTVTGNRGTKTVSVPYAMTGASDTIVTIKKQSLTTVADNFYVYFPKEYIKVAYADIDGRSGAGGTRALDLLDYKFGQPYTGTASRTYALEVLTVNDVNAGGTTYPWGTDTPAKIMGLGKTNCEYIMNVESSGYGTGGFRLADFVNVRTLPNSFLDTIWSLMCQVNAGTLDSDLSEGFTDWYIPSAYEGSMMGSVLGYGSGTSSFCIWAGYKYNPRPGYGCASCLSTSIAVNTNGEVPSLSNSNVGQKVRFIRSF